MIQCPNCLAMLPDSSPARECPKCGKAIVSPTSAKTRPDATLNVPSPQHVEPSSHSNSESNATINVEMLAGLGDSEAIGATLGPVSEQANINPMATMMIGPSGITVGRSASPHSLVKESSPSAGANQTGSPGKTAGNTANGAADSSLDFNRSVLSTISKRTLSEKAGSFDSTPDYEIVSKLGEGGMGVVYSAIQKTLDRKVAIKAIKSGKATSDESRRKFFYEAQITSDLGHPNIVPIHEMGSNDDGTLFYSMKMVNGTPWKDVILDKDRLENIEIFMKVCDAVAFAHSRNIIHRDLKPENVMLGAFGEVLVMDWGLAVNLNTNHSFGLSGTPVYMAPEMAKHEVSKIGKASDIYILGAILFQIIVGNAPHKGKTVGECMANATQNINIDPGFEDPLLDIANHAMATEPSDRYESVIAFQDAIREHLRYAQSIALTHRGEELLENSIRDKDYQGFSRALFSMQDAIELWPENHAASDGLHRTRLAYGQCALDRSDYDLCLQTLDTRFEDEATLHSIATQSRAGIVQREKRFKLLRKVLAAVILFAVVSLTLATLYARRQETLALNSAQSEKTARVNEKEAKQVAQAERDRAQQSAVDEKAARKDEEAAKQLAQAERDRAILAEEQQKQAKELEVVARKQAVASEQKAIQSEQVAVRNARLALLGNYQSGLNLALNQTNQFDIARSNQLLQQIKTIEKIVGVGNSQPLLQNWAFRRIELLNNSDLPKVHVDSPITAFQFAPASKRGIIGTLSGRVSIVQLGIGNTALVPDRTLMLPDLIHAVAISPDSEEAMIATGSQRSEYTVYRWTTSSRDAVPVRSLGKRDLQQLAISPNGEWAIGGINAGLWKWERSANGFDTEPSQLDCHGSLKCMQFRGEHGSEIFGLTTLPNGKSACIHADLKTNLIRTYLLPESIANQVSTAVMSLDQQRIYLGLANGNLLVAKVDPVSIRSVSKQQNFLVQAPFSVSMLTIESEIQPKKHSTAVRGIEVHSDGTVLTHSDEPVVHVWRAEPKSSGLTYASFLVGLQGNVTNAKFLGASESVVATDDLGNLIQWNILDQERRRMYSLSVPSRLLSQSMSLDGTIRSINKEGVLRTSKSADDSEAVSFIGHTPGARVTDIAVASSEPLVATVALLPSTVGLVNSSEVCLWNASTRTMLHRSQYNTVGSCRIAFVNQDKDLVLGDGKETIVIPVSTPDKSTVETRFGTRLVATHPTQSSVAAWIASSGAVRLVDWGDPTKWDDQRYRYFDIAINNRFEPIEADWSADGKRLYIFFEQGRIARLEWDGVSLKNLSWTEEIPAMRSLEQETPWRYYDFEVQSNSDNSDRLKIVLRTSESKPTSKRLQLDWNRSEKSSGLTSGPSSSETALPIEYSRPSLHDIARQATVTMGQGTIREGAMVAVDRQGTLTFTTQNKATFSLGRPVCLQASHSGDGRRWSTVHAGGTVLLATTTGTQQVEWHQINHPFAEISQAELSVDGQQLAILGRLPNGKNQLARFDVTTPKTVVSIKGGELPGIQFVRWHPVDNEFVVLDSDQNWRRIDDDGKVHEIRNETWSKQVRDPSFRFVSMEWLSEPIGVSGKPSWYMAVLSRSQESSRIDFLSKNAGLTDFQPIVSKSTITSFASAPNENVMAVGDENGTLGIWFVAPSIDQSPRELFTLAGHRGSEVCQLSFSSDGATILSSDTSQRAIHWRSR